MPTSQLSSVPDIETLGRVSDYAYEFAEIARRSALFGNFSLNECNIFSDYMKCFGVPRATPILQQDHRGDMMIIVLTGSVHMVREGQGAQESRVVGRIGPGGVAGELSLIDGREYELGCVAAEPTDFAVLTRESLAAVVTEHPRVGNKFFGLLLQALARRLREFTGPFGHPALAHA